MLSDVVPTLKPTFSEFTFKKKGEENITGKLVNYWTMSPEHLIEADISRLLCKNKAYESITFQYKVPSSHGVNCLIGADHGTGKSRYLIQVNNLPSSFCCEKSSGLWFL